MEQSDDADEPPTIIGCLHYNVDADPSAQSNDDLDDGDRLDLLRYRCSIRTDLGPDQWPFENTFVERAP